MPVIRSQQQRPRNGVFTATERWPAQPPLSMWYLITLAMLHRGPNNINRQILSIGKKYRSTDDSNDDDGDGN